MPDASVRVGDAFEWLSQLPGSVAHAAVVDYPWETIVRVDDGREEFRSHSAKRGPTSGYRDKENDDLHQWNYEPDHSFVDVLGHLSRVVVDGGYLMVCADDVWMDKARAMIKDSDFVLRRNWVWWVNSIGFGYYGRVNHYPIIVATNGETERWCQSRKTCFHSDWNRRGEHDTQKPTDIWEWALAPPVLKEGETLVVPFCGTAPEAPAAVGFGADFRGCELDPDTVSMAANMRDLEVLEK